MNEITLKNVGSYSARSKWVPLPEPWVVREPEEKLRTKYKAGPTLIFDHFVFAGPRRDPNRIDEVDIIAVDRLMNGNVARKTSTKEHVLEVGRDETFQQIMEGIPREATIDDDKWDGPVSEAVESLRGQGVQLAIATKLLMVKRPYLVPMLDNVLQDAFGKSEVTALVEDMRKRVRENEKALHDLVECVDEEFGIRVSPLRILEQLIWFDWNTTLVPDHEVFTVIGFDEWGYSQEHIEKGVHLLSPTERPRTRGAHG